MDSKLLVDSLANGLLGWYEIPDECNVCKIEDAMSMFEKDAEFDVIISMEDIEKSEHPVEYLDQCKKHLKSSGRLFLGVNNRYALKYFCGDRDPYTDRNFDGIEGYKRAYSKKEDVFLGRCYSKAEWKEMLEAAGIRKYKFYSVFQDLTNPCLIYAEDYIPNEDLSSRMFPLYNSPSTVFLEERELYDGIARNGMLHQMAEAYLIECTIGGSLSDVLQVTSSLERGVDNALYTIIHKSGIVEKKAVYEEGQKRIQQLSENIKELANNGIPVVEHELRKNIYTMPYVEAEIGQVYLKRMLHEDPQLFLKELDHFRDLILKSSSLVKEDVGDGEGAVLKYGYMDMVPLNSFHKDGTFVFFDQEFKEKNIPVNVLLWRMIATMYYGDMEMSALMPMDALLEHYDLKRYLKKWQKAEWDFLAKLRNDDLLRDFHKRKRADLNVVNSNRQRMNYSADDYQRLFVDIFRNADTRKLILFGSGNFTKKFLSIYGADYEIYAIIDNNKEKWGSEISGIMIQSPDILKSLHSGEYKVIICIKNYVSVMKQLDALGVGDYSIYDWNKDYPRKLRPIINREKQEDSTMKKYHIGYVGGVFDMFHVGHVNLLRKAKEQCDYLIVGIVSDEGVYRLKERYPVIPQEERAEVVRSCRYADQVEVLPVDYAGIRDAYKMFQFDCQFSGDDHRDNPEWLADKQFLEKNGADIVFFPYTEKISSTKIRESLDNGGQ